MPLGSGSAVQKFCLAEKKGVNKQANWLRQASNHDVLAELVDKYWYIISNEDWLSMICIYFPVNWIHLSIQMMQH